MQDDTQLRTDALARLEKAADWLVRDGVEYYRANGAKGLKSHLIDHFLVNLWVTPVVPQDSSPVRLAIKSRGINFDINRIKILPDKGRNYELWMAQISGQDWSGQENSCRFYIVSEDDKKRRDILLKTQHFKDRLKRAGEADLVFPTDDLATLYELRAWKFADCFSEYKFAEKEIYFGAGGKLQMK